MSNEPRTRPTEDDEGKDVIDSSGERIGIVAAVDGGDLHVETDPGLTDEITARLGWGDDEDTRTIREENVDRIVGDEIHIRVGDPPRAGAAGEMIDIDETGTEPTGGGADEISDVGEGIDTGEPSETTGVTEEPTGKVETGTPRGDVSGDETAREMDDTGTVTDTGERPGEEREEPVGAPGTTGVSGDVDTTGTIDEMEPGHATEDMDEGVPAEDVGDPDERRSSEPGAETEPGTVTEDVDPEIGEERFDEDTEERRTDEERS